MKWTREQLISACQHEWEWLCHEDYNPEEDRTMEEHLEMLKGLTFEQLMLEAMVDNEKELDEFMGHHYSQ